MMLLPYRHRMADELGRAHTPAHYHTGHAIQNYTGQQRAFNVEQERESLPRHGPPPPLYVASPIKRALSAADMLRRGADVSFHTQGT